jgi:hypothetical protein
LRKLGVLGQLEMFQCVWLLKMQEKNKDADIGRSQTVFIIICYIYILYFKRGLYLWAVWNPKSVLGRGLVDQFSSKVDNNLRDERLEANRWVR